jgi:F-type H+-transporting ATPase subunit b
MPQFDPSVWSPQLLWLALVFIGFYLVMARVVVPRMTDVLEDREFRINDSLRKAEGLRQDAEDVVSAYEKMMADARAKAQEQIRQVRERAAADATERHAELTERLSQDIGAAEARISAAKAEAIAGIRGVSVEIAAVAAERLLGAPLEPALIGAAVDRSIEEMRG